ncbi:hypothetical protein EG68_03195 [Paragonimus skrjabini miyazakii]|uniref:C3H1-type domain-containing protein n=1 Tax=Paragonimus skrjabini miyazakii TaxID=59628 RepID=A0A8S9Z7G8_9TREM|nr:hypothetical protein EG68_03195 [Paragonimus skrjabini miyazakii]
MLSVPDHLLSIVETAWAAYSRETFHEVNQWLCPYGLQKLNDRTVQSSDSPVLTLFDYKPTQTAHTTVFPKVRNCRETPSPASQDSGIDCDRIGVRSFNFCGMKPKPVLADEKLYASPIRPRPLLKKTDICYASGNEDVTLQIPSPIITMNASNACSSPARPMQVHKHQHMPRRQDAIYNARYKTQPCLHYQKYKRCPLGDNCHFAHGPHELMHPQSHPKYRTRLCMNYVRTGLCPFGNKCYFLHSIPKENQPSSTITETKVHFTSTTASANRQVFVT